MIKNYFKIALRSFRKHKLFTFINVVGLSIGISAAVVIYLIVQFDLNFNRFDNDTSNVYRIVTNYSFAGNPGYNGGVCGPLTVAVKNQVPGVDQSAPFFTLWETKVNVPGEHGAELTLKKEKNIVLADGQYFNLFHYNWLAGSAKSALNRPNQLVITSQRAQLYFPNVPYDRIIGREVIYEDTIKTTVSGVVQSLPANTDFAFTDFISYSSGNTVPAWKDNMQLTEWGSTTSASQLFVKLNPRVSPQVITRKINDLLKKYNPPKAEDKGNSQSFSLQPLANLHFSQQYFPFDNGSTVSLTTLYGLLIIGAFLLVLGCINFINLTTAQASQRAKEIGIRKTMGSTRSQLIMQFLSETFLVTLLAVIISVCIAPVILKLFADFIPPGISANLIHQPDLVIFLIVLTIGVSLLSGFYPALVLSGYKPVAVLKTQANSLAGKTRNAVLRKSLTVTQFVIAQFFIMATVLVSKQIYYALNKDLGFKKDAIVNISTPFKSLGTDKQQVFLNAVRNMPQVQMVSVGGAAPSSSNTNSTTAKYTDGKKEVKTDVEQKFGDENYIKLYNIKLLAGRSLQPADTGRAFVINNTYAKTLGFRNPADAIGKVLDYNDRKMEIIGVANDFYQKSLHSAIRPLVILQPFRNKWNNRTLHIALKPQTAGGTEWTTALDKIGSTWKNIYPEDDFEYTFYDEAIAKFYTVEQNTTRLLTWATGLSVFISCLGLLGLAMYTTGQRTKEIGVRKVLGASVGQIVALLSKELIWLIVLAFVLVTPIAYYAMQKWTENFVDRTPISWWVFVLSGAGMLVAALFTSSFQTVKAAAANPVKSLKTE
ncbi:ABC transporter permease [Mucilaginibacter terrenus]|uniref:ABC transporter permease n=1 Tax=Mucilaginibacter terrenus TaxID=2482727 RepID=A0A3E2NTZ0_9SPHI|nr:ABC transporter permease [Mucilaginibacter terrenus]RFZ84482.1 ABC transporter permease [Mucilaginibacter terrenus]